ncbi:MAG: DNA mismatch repair protein MutS [Alphaproteobacteria bacterium]|nr:DNA mismatch repair protein MutS [Alphaproteobacteria bacterium]
MPFQSILFDQPEHTLREGREAAPDFFADLNLDQLVEWIVAGKDEYALRPFFFAPLRDVRDIQYRHEVMRDLECKEVSDLIYAFGQDMRLMRQELAQGAKLYYKHQRQWWFVDAVEAYGRATASLLDGLRSVPLHSRGLIALRSHLAEYVAAPTFTALVEEARRIKDALADIEYCFVVRGSSVTVRNSESESNYSVEVERTFEKFAQGAAKDYRVKFHDTVEMDHVEANILEFVAALHPEPFAALGQFCAANQKYQDPVVVRFDREVQFYLSYLEFIGNLRHAGLPFCYPRVTCDSKEVFSDGGFDLALAHKLNAEHVPVVSNDYCLQAQERVFVVSGPNQGGKTTFARAFGQHHYFASLGLPVPGRAAQLFLFDQLFTHFEREERVTDLRSKLESDLIRLHDDLNRATPDSVFVLNESFGSTTLKDAIFLGTEIMRRILELDALAVYVSFVTELATLSDKTVSMVSTIVPDDPAMRTFKIVRRPLDGRAYASSIADKYRLSYGALKERLAS